MNTEFIAEFVKRIDRAGSCHHWTGATTNGLPSFRGRLATRVTWEIANGSVPAGRHVRRRCSAPLCIRVEHLTVDPRERVKRPSKTLSRFLAEDIRVRHRAGETVAQLAENYNVTKQHVYGVLNGRVWAGDGTRKPKPGSVMIVGVGVDADGVTVDKLACGHAVPAVNWPNRWRRCPSCAEALEAAP